jgi:stage II sporulation protein D
VIARSAFLKGVGAASVLGTGGLDVWDPTTPQIRVLLASDVRGETPRVYGDGTFSFAGKRWRGAPSTIGMPDGRLALVTTIDIDLYLQGVVPLESPPSWPTAALQAQAIVARTFALARRSLSRPWDLQAGDIDQSWGGVDAEHPAATAAIQTCRGRTLTYGGALASVFYSSCCGGHTADITTAWNGAPLPYLRGVVDPYCVAAPEYRWSRTVPLERVVTAFGARTGGTVTGIALTAPDAAGRPRGIALQGTTAATIPVSDFRRALGYDVVRSLWLRTVRIDAAPPAPRLVMEGSGHGHGVGMCQWGTKFFAAGGAGVAEILAFYFPGTTLTNG